MDSKEIVMQALREKRLNPTIDEDGDIVFKWQLKKLCFITKHLDQNFLHLLLPCFRDVEEGNEVLELATCNKVTRDIRYLKTFVLPDGKSISASMELLFVDEASLRKAIDTSLELIGTARSIYRTAREELQE